MLAQQQRQRALATEPKREDQLLRMDVLFPYLLINCWCVSRGRECAFKQADVSTAAVTTDGGE